MSLMTSGVKIRLLPRMNRSDSAGALPLPFLPLLSFFIVSAQPLASQHQFLFRRLEIVVVPQLLAGDDLAEGADAVLRQQLVAAELGLEPALVEISDRAPHGIDAEALRLAGDIDRAVIHGIAEILPGIAADHHPPALHHAAGDGPGIAADDDRSAFLVDARARADIAAADEIAAADGGAELRARVLLDQDRPAHHILGARPADPARDPHIRPVAQAAAEIAERAVDDEIESVQDPDRDRMLGAGIADDNRAVAVRHQFANTQIDGFGLELAGVDLGALVEVDLEGVRQAKAVVAVAQIDVEEFLNRAAFELLGMQPHLVRAALLLVKLGSRYLCHTRISSSYGSNVSISRGMMARMATSSEASATRLSLS